MPDPFITPQDLVDYLGKGNIADPGMLIVTDAACDMVRTVADQDFNAGTTTVKMDGTGTDALLLKELPVTSVTSVSVAGTTITDWMVNDNGILFRGTAGADPRPTWPLGRQNVQVTYVHGYATVDIPRDVKMVALAIASRLAVQGPALQESIGAVTMRYGTNATDLTKGEQMILRKYKPTR